MKYPGQGTIPPLSVGEHKKMKPKNTRQPHPIFGNRLKVGLLLSTAALVSIAWPLLSHADSPLVQGVKPLPLMQQHKGRQLFSQNCSQCHGALADGVDGKGPPLVHPIYRTAHHADISFYRAAERGVRAHHWPFGDMPSQPQLQVEQVTQIIAYLRDLQSINGIK